VQQRYCTPAATVVVFVYATVVAGTDAEAEMAVALFFVGMGADSEGQQGKECGFGVVHGVS